MPPKRKLQKSRILSASLRRGYIKNVRDEHIQGDYV